MKRIFLALIIFSAIFFLEKITEAGNIGDPGATLSKGSFSLGSEFSGVSREIRDGEGVRYDTESWRLILKGS